MVNSLRYSVYLLVLLSAGLFISCSNVKHLPKGESLYIGSKVNIKDKETKKKERKLISGDLENSVRPKPNTKTLGMRIKPTLYTLSGSPKKKKGIRAWLHNKVGEPPVLISTVHLQQNETIILNILQNKGFFYASVNSNLVTKHKKTSVIFDVTTGKQFIVNKVVFVKDSDQIYKDIDSDFNETLLTPGAPYNLDLIKAEFTRIAEGLKEKGYFYFKSNYVLAKVDTGIGNNKIDMYLTLKEDSIPDDAYNIYRINDIFIYPNFRLGVKHNDTDKNNATVFEGLHIVDTRKTFVPSLFSKTILFDTGDIYSESDQNRTLSRLVNLGTFKFVKNRFQSKNDSLLDVYYYLTPFPRKSLRFEIGALTQNDNRVGSEGSISWRNRNSFKGGEELVFKINGGFEKQYSELVKEPNIYNLGAETDLKIPHFVVPFADITSYSQFIPKTMIKAAYKYESESDLLRINSYTLSYGYDWRENKQKEHQLYPFNFTYVKTDTLGNTDRLRLLYANLVFNGIIIGPTYEFTYNSQTKQQKKNSFYFDGLTDISGNILGLAEHADYKNNPQTIFGSQYAQYLKFQADFRYYRRFSKTSVLANRLLAGVGFPYGNSYQLPNIKQFWAGGNSDLRGFPSRLVGPGTFNEFTVYGTNAYLETLGDIKVEFNTELRKSVYKILGLALFFEAGNIWLSKSNPAYPGGVFTSQFYKELAADVGAGLRFDFQIFIIRLDMGIPIYKPWLAESERWVLNKFDFGNRGWKKNNMVFNFGIGYPF